MHVVCVCHVCVMCVSCVCHVCVMCVSCLIYKCRHLTHYSGCNVCLCHSYVWHDLLVCDVTHFDVWRDSFMREHPTGSQCIPNTNVMWRDSFWCVSWLIHTIWRMITYEWVMITYDTWSYEWVMTHMIRRINTWHNASSVQLMHCPNVWHNSFICVMTHSCTSSRIHMCHDPFVCVMIHSYVYGYHRVMTRVCHDSFIRDPFVCVMTHSFIHVWMSHDTHDSWLSDTRPRILERVT